jgi:TPR repeat protein
MTSITGERAAREVVRAHRRVLRVRDPGEGIDQDPKKAAEIYSGLCAGGYGGACLSMAELYDRGLGVKKDRKKAAAMRKRARALGVVGE